MRIEMTRTIYMRIPSMRIIAYAGQESFATAAAPLLR
jgi:hypothetical protein